MTDTEYLDGFIGELLHINEVSENKLVDLNASGGAYKLMHTCIDVSAYTLKTVSERIGKTGNTILLDSALSGGEQRVNRRLNTFAWEALGGGKDVKALHSFIANARKELISRGNNPLFMGVGALKWRVAVRENGREVLRDVTSPLLVFPVRLVVTGNSAPVVIEFIDDDIYINPCLVAKLAQVFGEEVAYGLPAAGKDLNSPVDLALLGDGVKYFQAVSEYVSGCNQGAGTLFEFDKDMIAIAQYKHDELCTYYDIRRNRDKIYSHPLVERVFSRSTYPERRDGLSVLPEYVLQRDSVQENIITRAANGESLIVKGPPGTGKTVTIANMLAALISQNKKVIFASKKISALTEVYAKLPERLRKFVLLLDSETEKSSAKINPDEIKQDFKRLIAEAKEYREPASLSADLRQANAERARAMRSLSSYIDLTFNGRQAAGGSLYSALDAVCKSDLPAVDFISADEVKKVTREQYNHTLSQVAEAGKYFSVLGKDGAYPVYKCPWFGVDVSCDSEGAMALGGQIAADFNAVYPALLSGLGKCGLAADGFTISQILNINGCTLEEGSIRALFALAGDGGAEKAVNKIAEAYAALLQTPDNGVTLKELSKDETDRRALALSSLKTDKNLNCAQIELINSNGDIFFPDGPLSPSSLSALCELFGCVAKIKAEAEGYLKAARETFKSGLDYEELQLVSEARGTLSGYFKTGAQKPKALDFKAKKYYRRLCALSYLKSPSFADITGATEQMGRAEACLNEAAATRERANKIFRKSLSESEWECAEFVFNACASAELDACAYVKSVQENYALLSECFSAADKPVTVEQLTYAYTRASRFNALKSALADFTYISFDGAGKEEKTAREIVGAYSFLKKCAASGATAEAAVNAVEFIRGESGVQSLCRVTDNLRAFGGKYFRNYYSINGEDTTLGDMCIFSDGICDRTQISAAVNYTAIKNSPLNFGLNEFFYPFERDGLKEGEDFTDIFEHSFFSAAVNAEYSGLGIVRNGLGEISGNCLEALKKAENKLNGLNAQLIESKALSRIDCNDADFSFVQDRNPNENLRLMFRRNARAILKLKRCMILSPYTASLLFREEEFADFDVLIVDEASQLEPALVLPVLFRAKQCIIVGDEWQMPPIKHFTVRAPSDYGDGEGYSALESEISVLGLALRNGGFPVEELLCHYRSKTETLIKFSQEMFYPNMRTFPAPVPARAAAKGVAALGLKDVYVPDGVVASGRNEAEAAKVVEELNRHFDNYYDEKTHKLSLPVGVVAFGEAQCSLIESKVKADRALDKKICDALEHFDDLPEKLIFFKTIETVQGQETGHLILSITHGRRESGLHMNFGQLNQGNLGRCIFNVAVTRAQYCVTVVHSVRAAEVTGESVSYIRDYLSLVERFASDGAVQFVSESAPKGFVHSVAEFIKSTGIAPERVVENYGVTDGSVRIPVVVLDRELKRALLGVLCEVPVGGKYDFIDYNMRYRASLEVCGWRLHGVSVHGWVDNPVNERKALERALADIKKQEENNNG